MTHRSSPEFLSLTIVNLGLTMTHFPKKIPRKMTYIQVHATETVWPQERQDLQILSTFHPHFAAIEFPIFMDKNSPLNSGMLQVTLLPCITKVDLPI